MNILKASALSCIVGEDLRIKRACSQDQFDDRSRLNRAHVGEIERGDSNVTIQTLKVIADTLGLKIRDLMKGA